MPKTYLYVNRNAIRLNREWERRNDPRHPMLIVSDGKGHKRKVHRAEILGPSILKADLNHPIDDDAQVFIETDSEVRTT